jgi:hypothetical protein
MKKKYKLTGFARLFIFMLFFLPIVYIGVSYYHGENPLAKVQEMFGSDKKEDKPYISKERFGINDDDDLQGKINDKDREIKDLKRRIQSLERKLQEVQDQSHDH